jgi:hypothetical protein
MASKLRLVVAVGCAMICQSVSAQTPAAQIKKTSTPPVIDGNGNDAVWANANAYGTTTWFQAEPQIPGVPLEPSADFTVEWRALWDDTNLYIMTKVNDDAIVNSLEATGGPDAEANFNDDGIEFYIDAQNVNNLEYNPGGIDPNTGEVVGTSQPTYQFTAIAGWTPEIANDPNYLRLDGFTPVSPRSLRDPASLPNTSITYGINSYDGNDVDTRYPQTMGSATSGPVTENPAGGFDWTFEASFPWEALDETPADVLARDGIFGFGVAYNDDDDREGRDAQYMWGTDRNDLWHVSEAFPDVQLVDAPAGDPGDFDGDGDVDGGDLLVWQRGVGGAHNATTLAQWMSNFGSASTGAIGSVPEPAGAVIVGAAVVLLRNRARRRGRAIRRQTG